MKTGAIRMTDPIPKRDVSLMPGSNGRLCYPDALRGLASFWVICQHLSIDNHIPQIFAVMPALLKSAMFDHGNLGVAIFFVMSGFFLAQSLRATQVTWQTFPMLLLRRGLRLSPAYYVAVLWAIACAAFVAFYFGRTYTWPNPFDLLIHGLYLQGFVPVAIINEVFWTLYFEMQFFCAFCLLLGLSQWLERRWQWPQARTVVFMGVAIVALLWPARLLDRNFPLQNAFFSAWFACSLGVFAYWAWQRQLGRRGFYSYLGLVVVATLLGRQFFPGVCGLTAVSLLEVARSGRLGSMLNWRWLQALGLVSYTVYLVHEPLLKVLFSLEHAWWGQTIAVDMLGLMVNIPLCYGVAVLLHYGVEKPSVRWSRGVGKG
jgi:peptidoglycan/LPS O-acetylase OafA/YrhL